MVTTEDGPRVWVETVKLLVACTAVSPDAERLLGDSPLGDKGRNRNEITRKN